MVVAEVSAACSGGVLRVPARGMCSAVIMVAPTRAAASAWTGAIAGSLGAGWPRVTAISSMISERAKTAHSSQAASARKADDHVVGQRPGEKCLDLLPSGPGPGQR